MYSFTHHVSAESPLLGRLCACPWGGSEERVHHFTQPSLRHGLLSSPQFQVLGSPGWEVL